MTAILRRMPLWKKFFGTAAILGLVFLYSGGPRLRASAPCAPTALESIQTDQAAYSPGQRVAVTGAGFAQSCSVTIRVVRPDGSTTLDGAATDADGNVSYSWTPGALTGRYVLDILGEGDYAAAAVAFANGPTLASDKGDYRPGERARLTGEHFQPGEEVTIVVRPAASNGAGRVLETTADESGSFTNFDLTFNAADSGVLFEAIATGRSSGLSTKASFTDAGAFVGNIGIASGQSSGLTSLTINATGGVTAGHSIIVAWVTGGGTGLAPAPSCSDSTGLNTYNLDVNLSNGTNPSLWICSSHNVAALSTTDTITVNFPSTTNAARATANEFSGLTSPLAIDQQHDGSGGTALPNSGDTPLTTQADEILFGAITFNGTNNGQLSTPGTGYTLAGPVVQPAVPSRGLAAEYRIVSSTGTYHADATLTTGNFWLAAIATYKVAAAPTPTSTPTTTQTPLPLPSVTPTDTPTNTPVPPTNTPTNTPVPPTNTPTNTATNTPTNTPVPPTNTPTNTPTPTFTPILGGTSGLTVGFWQNKNGQPILKGDGTTAGVCNLTSWLRQYAPFQDLSATSTCTQVAAYVTNVIKAANASGASMNATLKAQMLSTALDVYFSDPALGGNKINAPAPIGGLTIDLTKICSQINGSTTPATCVGSYQDASSAFGGANSLTVSQMLASAASQSNSGGGTWYSNDKPTQQLAKNAFDAINNRVAFTI
ncbi:MAG TPA: hypothetical protein VKH43_06665 [Thermoanaerobaculia bacterium]|nr:hypothetical protein [Thermoanaerobaculia bacterium]